MLGNCFFISKALRRNRCALIRIAQPLCTKVDKASSVSPETSEAATRSTNESPELPPTKKKGGMMWKLIALTLVGVGGVTGYALYDTTFRRNLEGSVPYSKEYLDFLSRHLSTTPTESQHIASIDKKPVSPEGTKKVTEPVTIPEKLPVVEKTKAELEEERKRAAKEKAQQELKQREAAEAAENIALESTLKRYLASGSEAVGNAIVAHRNATESIRQHNKQLKEALEAGSEEQWANVIDLQQLRSDGLWAAQTTLDKAQNLLDKLKQVTDTGSSNKVTRKNQVLLSTKKALNEMTSDVKNAITELEKAKSETRAMVEFRDMAKKAKEQFKKELESIVPDVKIGQRLGGKLTEDELNSLIAHAHRRVEQLQRQLAEQLTMEQVRVQTALEKQRQQDELLADARINDDRDKLARDIELQKQKWEVDSRVEFEQELRQQLSRQAAAHSDHIIEVLKIQEREHEMKFAALLRERVQEESDKLQLQIGGWVARLRGIETAIDNRAEMEKQGHKAQELWLACQALQTCIKVGLDSFSAVEEHLKPLQSELTAIRNASDDSPFVNAIIQAVPTDAVQRGVWTEDALLERFSKVQKVSKRVALIDETGGTLFRFFLSYLQSVFVLRATHIISDDEPIDPVSLSIFTILDNAAYHLEHRNVEQAIRFVNLLHGESRRVASDWLKEARLYLETKQAADALLAYASASGISSLY